MRFCSDPMFLLIKIHFVGEALAAISADIAAKASPYKGIKPLPQDQ
jgi:hypothetical protein